MFITHVSNLSSSTSPFRNIVLFFLRVCSGSYWTYQHPPTSYFWLLHCPDIPPDSEVQFHSVPSGLLQIFFCLVRCWPAWPISLKECSIPESQTNGPLPPLSQDDADQQLLREIWIWWQSQSGDHLNGAGFWDQTLLRMMMSDSKLMIVWAMMSYDISHTFLKCLMNFGKFPGKPPSKGDIMKFMQYFTGKERKIVEVDSRWWT